MQYVTKLPFRLLLFFLRQIQSMYTVVKATTPFSSQQYTQIYIRILQKFSLLIVELQGYFLLSQCCSALYLLTLIIAFNIF
jgi:hypothetical protein